MQRLKTEPTDDSPYILLDKSTGTFEIAGKSLPEDVAGFFEPVIDWLEAYAKDPLDQTDLHFRLVYFNTASSKLILDILMIMEEIKESGKGVTVHWHSPAKDEDMQEAGSEYAEMVEVDFVHETYD